MKPLYPECSICSYLITRKTPGSTPYGFTWYFGRRDRLEEWSPDSPEGDKKGGKSLIGLWVSRGPSGFRHERPDVRRHLRQDPVTGRLRSEEQPFRSSRDREPFFFYNLYRDPRTHYFTMSGRPRNVCNFQDKVNYFSNTHLLRQGSDSLGCGCTLNVPMYRSTVPFRQQGRLGHNHPTDCLGHWIRGHEGGTRDPFVVCLYV